MHLSYPRHARTIGRASTRNGRALARRLVLSVVTGLVACGGSDSPSSPSGSGGNTTPPPAASTLTSIVLPDSVVVDTWGDTSRVSFTALDQRGQTMSGVTPTWSSSDTTIATVDAAGLVTSLRAGIATITARVNTVQGTSRAVVALQRNSACHLPAAPGVRGAVHGPVSFVDEGSARFPGNTLPAAGNDLVVFDYNADGKPDILQLNSTYSGTTNDPGVTIFWQNTGSGFVDATAALFGSTVPLASFPHNPIVADFNGDGRADIYLGQSGFDSSPFPGARNILLLSSGSQLVDRTSTNLVPAPIGHTHGAAAADVDCDGDVDLFEVDIATPSVPNDFRFMLNAGGGMFTNIATSRFGTEITGLSNAPFLSLLLCDLDRDGDADFVGGGWRTSTRSPDRLYVNDGFGHFRREDGALPTPFYGDQTNVIDLRCLDFDGDGYADIVASVNSQYTTGRIALWHNNHDMTFTDVTVAATGAFEWPANTFPGRSWVADFNNDGWPDILSQGYGDPWNGFWSSSVQGGNGIYFNNGDGSFQRVALANQWGPLWPIDVNSDGRIDLIWGGYAQTSGIATQRIYIQP